MPILPRHKHEPKKGKKYKKMMNDNKLLKYFYTRKCTFYCRHYEVTEYGSADEEAREHEHLLLSLTLLYYFTIPLRRFACFGVRILVSAFYLCELLKSRIYHFYL